MSTSIGETSFHFYGTVETQTAAHHSQMSAYQFACMPGRLRIDSSPRHILLFNTGGPLTVSHLAGSEWKSLIVEKDSLICLLPTDRTTELRWSQDLHLRAVLIDPVYTDSIFPDVPLEGIWNVSDIALKEFSERIFDTLRAPVVPEKTYAASLINLCFLTLSWQQSRTPMDQPARGRLAPRQLVQVISFAHDSLHLDIGLVDMANLVHLSAYHFGRLFKQTVGLSPYQYILQMKIEYAKKLIQENAGPLGDIAYQLNFSDQAHFSNAFRKATGISPRQYQHSRLAVL